MSIVINGKVKAKNVTRKFTMFNTTDGRQWDDAKMATKWQKNLNKTAQAVLDGKKSVLNGVKKTRAKKTTSRRAYALFSTPKRLAVQRLVNQTDSRIGSAKANVISINRLIQSLQSNPKLLADFNKILTAK